MHESKLVHLLQVYIWFVKMRIEDIGVMARREMIISAMKSFEIKIKFLHSSSTFFSCQPIIGTDQDLEIRESVYELPVRT